MKLPKYVALSSLYLVLSGCGGTQGPEVVIGQMTIQSTPSVCISPVGNGAYLCANTRNTNDYTLHVYGQCVVPGMEWGITRQVTVATIDTSESVADGCGYEISLISVDNEVEDPVGTRYKNGVGSSGGGLIMYRVADGKNWFSLAGYTKKVYCEDDICGQAAAGTPLYIPGNTEFELVEIDGERHIQLVASE